VKDARISGLRKTIPALCQDTARTAPIIDRKICDARHAAPPAWQRRQGKEGGSRPVSRVLSWATIPLGCTSPCTSSDLPGNTRGPRVAGRSEPRPACSPIWSCSGRGLPCRACCQARGALLPHHFTLASHERTRDFGGLLSVALSVGSRPPGVTWRPALWSPDFPPQAHPMHFCMTAQPAAVAWPTPARTIGAWPGNLKRRREWRSHAAGGSGAALSFSAR
jgi:hypothetical protein